ncbi:DUF2812 domain-containing protein [Clostridium sp.]|jgi:hypothetical protein|uniref:DUF2812 domain-containing protein n=1 Tax=Clostridium sp. TaxID=1506 RepID=UPI0025B91BC7|nr:DUF2812 domain-containing protein [Clostridium sp.]
MLRIRLYLGSKSVENYLNRKSKRGYQLDCIVPFGLFVPLRLDAYRFEKTTNKNRIYKVDSRSVSKDDLNDYIQLFSDDGWRIFKFNYSNGYYNTDYIFYSDDNKKKDIFSNEESIRKRNRDNAKAGLFKGIVLSLIFIIGNSILPAPLRESNTTLFGFLLQNIYIVIAIVIIFISSIRYWKNK